MPDLGGGSWRIISKTSSQTNAIDLAIANAENAAGGFGITPAVAEELLGLGLDVLTSGNHIWDKREMMDYLARQPRLLRPGNYPEGPGLRHGNPASTQWG